VISAGCDPGTTGITIAADDVKIQNLRVITFTKYGIDIQGRNRVRVKDVLALPHCPDLPIASINVVGGTRVHIDKGHVDAYAIVPPTGIHLSGLAAGANVRLRKSAAARHDVGIRIESCAPGSVRVQNSYANFNVTGILLENSDGIEIKKNQVAQNTDAGIVLDATSDDNRIIKNDISNSALDVSDAGTGNCWRDNEYTTGMVPLCP
jgi:parallel beta-helix repeat protein